MDLTDVFLVFSAGGVAGWALRGYFTPAPGPVAQGQRVFTFETAPGHSLHLHKLGELTDLQIEQLANWIEAGKPLSGWKLYDSQTGIMSRVEWERVRQELLDRGMAARVGRTSQVALSPTGIKSFSMLTTTHKQASDKRFRCKRASALVGGSG